MSLRALLLMVVLHAVGNASDSTRLSALARVDGPLAVELRGPLTTVVPCADPLPDGPRRLRVRLRVPADAPIDLGLGAYATDQHGRWFQRLLPQRLTPGVHALLFDLDVGLLAEPGKAPLTPADAAELSAAGIFLWSASASRAAIAVELLVVELAPPRARVTPQLRDLRLDAAAVRTGARWTMAVTPAPFPVEPDDPRCFALDLDVLRPDGVHEHIPAFADTPMARADRGDREVVTAAGARAFSVRYRPRLAGAHRLTLHARWADGSEVVQELPPLAASGATWDGFARVDALDPRFFSVAGAFIWPYGPNLHAVWDLRCQEHFATILPADRGTFAYDAYLARLGAHGGTGTEIWLSPWNFALEWRADWPGYHGRGRFSAENAWRLDHVLDAALAAGIHVNLVLQNHGQASSKTDAQWDDNPWNRARGGPLAQAEDYFTDPEALAGQARFRRYVVARWGDHPAILGWKLWSEVNLTEGGNRADWHRDAAASLRALDVYEHPVTTHWAGDYRGVNLEIARLPEIGYVCVDAYHGEDSGIAELLRGTTQGRDGLARLRKPTLVCEYGGNWNGTAPARLAVEHAVGPWAALVTGHAGGPMLWWLEWVDQREQWQPYATMAAFIAGEDLRAPTGGEALSLDLRSDAAGLWAKAWSKPGRMLGYVLDAGWSRGGPARLREGVTLTLGANVAAGALALAWWDADRGVELERAAIAHPGGALAVAVPAFSRHLAFKLWRSSAVAVPR